MEDVHEGVTVHDMTAETRFHREREHEMSRDCWCDPIVERFNRKTGEWEEVA